MMHIPRRRHRTRHTTLRSTRNRHWLSSSHHRRIQIQRIKRILLSRSSKRRTLKPTTTNPPVLRPRLGTFERRRRILWTRVLFLFILIVGWGGTVLGWEVREMTFWTGVFRRGELVGPTG